MFILWSSRFPFDHSTYHNQDSILCLPHDHHHPLIHPFVFSREICKFTSSHNFFYTRRRQLTSKTVYIVGLPMRHPPTALRRGSGEYINFCLHPVSRLLQKSFTQSQFSIQNKFRFCYEKFNPLPLDFLLLKIAITYKLCICVCRESFILVGIPRYT